MVLPLAALTLWDWALALTGAGLAAAALGAITYAAIHLGVHPEGELRGFI